MRLIDGNALTKEFLRLAADGWNRNTGTTWARAYEESEDMVDDMATIDPVKHGRWIKQNPMVDTEECSECGYNIPEEDFRTPFCPWCGARMDGDEE